MYQKMKGKSILNEQDKREIMQEAESLYRELKNGEGYHKRDFLPGDGKLKMVFFFWQKKGEVIL